MALVKCKECGKEIAKTAKVCPHCGFENKLVSVKESLGGCLVMIVLLAIAVVFFPSGSEDSKQLEKSRDPAISENNMKTEELIKEALGEEEYNRQVQEHSVYLKQAEVVKELCDGILSDPIDPPVTLCGEWGDMDLMLASDSPYNSNFHMLVTFDPENGDDLSQASAFCNRVTATIIKHAPIMKGWTLQIKTPRSPRKAVVTCTIGQ